MNDNKFSMQENATASMMQNTVSMIQTQTIPFNFHDKNSVKDILDIIEQYISAESCEVSLCLCNFFQTNKNSVLHIHAPEQHKIHSKACNDTYLFRVYVGKKEPHTRRITCLKSIPVSSIICFESLKRELILHVIAPAMQHQKFPISGSIAKYQFSDTFQHFIRLNRSFLVNPMQRDTYQRIFRT